MMNRGRWTLAVATALTLAACDAAPQPLPASGADVNGHEFSMAGLITGEVWADERGCVYIRTGDELVWAGWPDGYTYLQAPLRIMDAKGNVVAEAGHTARLGGGYVLAPENPCRTGADWWAVSSVKPSP